LYNPINLRNILDIKKTIDLKAISILNQGFCNLYNIRKRNALIDDIKYCNLIIKKKSLKRFFYYDCWAAHTFKYITFDNFKLQPNEPDIIGTSETIISLIKSYRILNDKQLKMMIFSACNFLKKYLYKDEKNRSYFTYHLTNNKIVINISAKAIEALSYSLLIKKDKKIIDICNKTIDFLINIQNKDGSWDYSVYENKKIYKQYDFHQGFILDGLISFIPYYNDENLLLEIIKKGSYFYKNKLFDEEGKSYYRHPIKYPIDIHNQAQGIITFHNLNKINVKYNSFENKIADWTIKNMQNESGYFYHQKWPFLINKIPYLRWSQSWMFKALSLLYYRALGCLENK